MATIIPLRGYTPQLGSPAFIAENATIVGDVVLGEQCSVWFNAVLRGDVNSIKIGNKVNIQDGVIIHGTFQRASTQIGDFVSIGHRALVHGCTIHNNVLIGMGAIVMDHAEIEENVIIGAGTVVLENTHLESGFIYAGVPAKKIKPLSPEMFQDTIQRISNAYIDYSSWYPK